jgi:hypothetical protein
MNEEAGSQTPEAGMGTGEPGKDVGSPSGFRLLAPGFPCTRFL